MDTISRTLFFSTLLFALSLTACGGDSENSETAQLVVQLSGDFVEVDEPTGEYHVASGRVEMDVLDADGKIENTLEVDSDETGNWFFDELSLDHDQEVVLRVRHGDSHYLTSDHARFFFGVKLAASELETLSLEGLRIELLPGDGVAYLEYQGLVGEGNEDFPAAAPEDLIYRIDSRWSGVENFLDSLPQEDCNYIYRDFFLFGNVAGEIAQAIDERVDPSPCDNVREPDHRIALPESFFTDTSDDDIYWDAYIELYDSDDVKYTSYSWVQPVFYFSDRLPASM